MKKTVISIFMLLVLLTGFANISFAANSVPVNTNQVLPQGQRLSEEELKDIKGEIAPWVVGAAIGGTTSAGLRAAENYMNGKRGRDVLRGCQYAFAGGAVSGALTAPVKVASGSAGIFTHARKVYDYSRKLRSVGAGIAGRAVERIYSRW